MVPGLYSGIDVRDDHPEPAGNLDGWEVERVEGIVNSNGYLKPELGKTYTIALRYPAPKEVRGFSGKELRWILMDGRALFTTGDFLEQVRTLKIKAGEAFQFVKLRGTNGNRGMVWKVERNEQAAITLLNEMESLDRLMPEGEEAMRANLDHALKTAIDAAAGAEKEGQRLGYNVRFTPADIRAMAISVLSHQGERVA